MKACLSVCAILLALLSRVSADEAVRAPAARVFATIPNEQILPNGPISTYVGSDKTEPEDNVAMRDVEIAGFITKNGDIFELSDSAGMGSIESRQASEQLEPGMTMCRYGTIVVYSDTDCNSFFKPSQKLEIQTTSNNKGDQTDVETEQKPLKKKKVQRKKQRKPNRKQLQKRQKNRKNKNKRNKQNQLRRKALKRRRANQNRRRNQNRRQNLQNRNKQQNQRRGNRNNVKRKRIQNNRLRSSSDLSDPPMEFAVLYNRP